MDKRASPFENTGIFLQKKCLTSVRLIHCLWLQRDPSHLQLLTASCLTKVWIKTKVFGHYSGCDRKHSTEGAPLSTCHSPKAVFQHNECFSFLSHASTITVINEYFVNDLILPSHPSDFHKNTTNVIKIIRFFIYS